MNNLTEKEQEVFDYMIKVEKINFAKSGKFGIFPNIKQVELVFDISRARANIIVNSLQSKLKRHLRQT